MVRPLTVLVWIVFTVLVAIGLSPPAQGADKQLISEFVLVAGHAADVHSSWNHLEANPILRNREGRFGSRGFMIGTGICAGLVIGGRLIVRRWPGVRPVVVVVNFVVGGLKAGVAVHNYRLPPHGIMNVAE